MLKGELLEFYESSPMKDALLCWYPFEHKKTDYIVLRDPKDYSVKTLISLRNRLSEHGRLLLAYENPFALRYWNGKRSPETGKPFDSLFGRDCRPSKAELETRLSQAGFEGQKWYYPLTDHWFTREVYSENYLPDEYLGQRFIPYMDGDEEYSYVERPLYREIIRGGAFSFMCGAYLVEARACKMTAPCPVDYAAVTAYRETSKRFATTIRNDGYVYKFPLHPDGILSLENTQKNHEELARLGVDVLPLERRGDMLVMPRVNLPTLWDYWAKKHTNGTFDKNEMYEHFDLIRDAIFKAAESGKCFWELVPANCFYDAQDNRLIFFDQEYASENDPPEKALVRAIWALNYSEALKNDPMKPEWLDALKKRYNLEGKWDELSKSARTETKNVFGNGCAPLEQATKKAAEKIKNNR